MNSSLLTANSISTMTTITEDSEPLDTGKSNSYFYKARNVCKVNLTSIFRYLDEGARFSGSVIEHVCRKMKRFPQYRFFTRPLHRSLAARLPRPIAALGTFIISDITLHQAPRYILAYLQNPCFIDLDLKFTNYFFITCGILVSYHKYRATAEKYNN
nr:hypothetical protein [Endozoicomonas sp.]